MARTSRQERRQRRGIAAGTPPLQPAPKPKAVEPVREEKVESAAPKSDAAAAGQSEKRRGIPGVRFRVGTLPFLFSVNYLQGAYFDGTGTFHDLRIGLWYAFTR